MGLISSDSDVQPQTQSQHVVLFPFMSKGHTIPLLHLTRLFLTRGLAVTVFTTPANRPFIHQSLADTAATVIDIPFPQNIPGIPTGIETTDKLPSMSLFHRFALATHLVQPHFERALQTLPRVSFMISDGFLWWTVDSATKFNFPRFVFYGFGNYAMSVSKVVAESQLLQGPESDNELITVTRFPWIKVTKNDFAFSFKDSSEVSEFLMKAMDATSRSMGLITNSFYELEPVFADYWNTDCSPKSWSIGPLFQLAAGQPLDQQDGYDHNKPIWVQWLDQKLEEGSEVLYIAFGSQAELSAEQLQEIANGLEKSKVNFLWVIRKMESETRDCGFEERVKGRGIVVKEWVDQKEILMHESVKGFLSHCGWNSVLESICAGVPILAWPMMAEQPLNARLVVEEIKVGLRVETSPADGDGFVSSEGLEKMVKELMEGEKGKEVRKKVKDFADMAKKAVKEGGSSWQALKSLIDETCNNTTADDHGSSGEKITMHNSQTPPTLSPIL